MVHLRSSLLKTSIFQEISSCMILLAASFSLGWRKVLSRVLKCGTIVCIRFIDYDELCSLSRKKLDWGVFWVKTPDLTFMWYSNLRSTSSTMLPWSSQPPWTECSLSCPIYLHWTLMSNMTEISILEALYFQAILLAWSVIIFHLLCMRLKIFLWVRILLIVEHRYCFNIVEGHDWHFFLYIASPGHKQFYMISNLINLLVVAWNTVHYFYLKSLTLVSTRQPWDLTQR